MDAAIGIRIAVFVNEQGVPMEEEIDQHDRSDRNAVHALVRDEMGNAVATGRYYMKDASTIQIGRMAVLPKGRGQGIGTTILERLMHEAKSRGFTHVALSAQVHAIPFYERHGFLLSGPQFDECGIPHQEMTRKL
jgi:predicted GNAT family N-acyltransferase